MCAPWLACNLHAVVHALLCLLGICFPRSVSRRRRRNRYVDTMRSYYVDCDRPPPNVIGSLIAVTHVHMLLTPHAKHLLFSSMRHMRSFYAVTQPVGKCIALLQSKVQSLMFRLVCCAARRLTARGLLGGVSSAGERASKQKVDNMGTLRHGLFVTSYTRVARAIVLCL